jgi:hypothetical protein
VSTDISEEHIASIFRVEDEPSKKPAEAFGSSPEEAPTLCTLFTPVSPELVQSWEQFCPVALPTLLCGMEPRTFKAGGTNGIQSADIR